MAQTFPGSTTAQEKSNSSPYMPQIPRPDEPTDTTNPVQPDTTDIGTDTTVTADDLNASND